MAQPPDGASLETILEWTINTPRDAEVHLPKLHELAKQCNHVTIMAKRREWDIAPLAAGCPTVISYLTEQDAYTARLHKAVKECTWERRCRKYTTHNRDSVTIREIEPPDMLLIDTVHDADRVMLELTRCADNVSRWIVLRGTANFGEVREGGGGPGLLVGVRRYIEEHPEWHRVYQNDNQYGLTVLSRNPHERTIDQGPGTELHNILASIGINPAASCQCRAKSRQMDVWGVLGCEEHFAEIVKALQEGQDQFGWTTKLKAAAGMVLTGRVFKVNWLDPFPDIIREAIERARQQDIAWAALHPPTPAPPPAPAADQVPTQPEELP
jgi:hypothetical protein